MAGSREKKLARIIQNATGAAYTECLRKLRAVTAANSDEFYFDRIEQISDDKVGTKDAPLCLDCLTPFTALHECT